MLPPATDPIAVYIHVPFCARRCPYCDFATVAGQDHLIERYTSTVCREIESSPLRGRAASSVYFGGGTPTHVSFESCITPIMQAVTGTFELLPDAEITFEANPASSDAVKYRRFRNAGFNRVSIGVQSFDDRVLQTLGRLHTADEAVAALRSARAASFRSVSLDLIFGAPNQSVEQWQRDLNTAVGLAPDHISAYSLTVEDGTPFASMLHAGSLLAPAEETLAAMFQLAINTLAQAGYEHYEVSSYALPGHRCRHNLVYWTHKEYAAFGPGAAAYTNGVRTVNERSPAGYIDRMARTGSAIAYSETLTDEQQLTEALMLGLRLLEGIRISELAARFGQDCVNRLQPAMANLSGRGLLDVGSNTVRLTRAGLMLADTVLVDLAAATG